MPHHIFLGLPSTLYAMHHSFQHANFTARTSFKTLPHDTNRNNPAPLSAFHFPQLANAVKVLWIEKFTKAQIFISHVCSKFSYASLLANPNKKQKPIKEIINDFKKSTYHLFDSVKVGLKLFLAKIWKKYQPICLVIFQFLSKIKKKTVFNSTNYMKADNISNMPLVSFLRPSSAIPSHIPGDDKYIHQSLLSLST